MSRPARQAATLALAVVGTLGWSAASAGAATQLEVVDVAGGARHVLAPDTTRDARHDAVAWTGDGMALTYVRQRLYGSGAPALMRQPVGGGPATVLRRFGTSAAGVPSPDGRLLALPAHRTPAGRARPFVVLDVATGRVRARVRPFVPLPRRQPGPIFVVDGVGRPCWSPDGRWLAIDETVREHDDSTRVVRVMDTRSGRIVRTWRGQHVATGGGDCFAPGGRLVLPPATPRSEAGLAAPPAAAARLLDVTTGAVTDVPAQGRSADGPLTWSPDGTRLALATGSVAAVLDPATGHGPGLPLVPHGPPGYRVAQAITALRWSPDGRMLAFVYDELQTVGGERPSRPAGVSVMPADGSAPPRELVRAADDGATITSIAWSPDGTRLALSLARGPLSAR